MFYSFYMYIRLDGTMEDAELVIMTNSLKQSSLSSSWEGGVVPGVEGADNNDYALVIRRWKNRGHDRSMNSAPPLPPAVDKLCRLCQQLQGRDNSIPSQQAYALNPPLALSIISDRMPACTCPTMSVCPFNYHWDYEL